MGIVRKEGPPKEAEGTTIEVCAGYDLRHGESPGGKVGITGEN